LLDRAAEMEVLAAMAGDGVVPMELTETQANEWSSMLKALEAAGSLDDDLTSAQAGDQYGLVGDQYGLVGDGYGVTKPNGKPPFVPAPDPLQVAPGAVPQGYVPQPGYAAAPGTTTYEEGAVTASAGKDLQNRILEAFNWNPREGDLNVNGDVAKASAQRAALTYGFPQGFLWSVYRDPSLLAAWGYFQGLLNPGGAYRP
jgi:hypothetical protein